MNRPGQKIATDLENLMPESCFMDLEQYKSKEVAEKIENKEAYDKTLNDMLKGKIKERVKELKAKRT
jgi:hypothetical protein